MRVELSKPESLQRMIDDLSNPDDQKARLEQDRERLEKRIEEIEKATEKLVKLVSCSDDDIVTELYEREIKLLADQRRGIEESLQQIQLSVREIEASTPDVPSLIELHNMFRFGNESWTDQQKRDELIRSGLRIYVDGRDFDIRILNGKTVATFVESEALLAFSTEHIYIPPWP